ncbi:hypothetical protein VNO77_10902 [Canavalia gladiata]|uniref:Uncharacterized protein n=1 Tax=Canavalia gladiata TaxID=3824 RepID=A0AAN9MBG0_CANGL
MAQQWLVIIACLPSPGLDKSEIYLTATKGTFKSNPELVALFWDQGTVTCIRAAGSLFLDMLPVAFCAPGSIHTNNVENYLNLSVLSVGTNCFMSAGVILEFLARFKITGRSFEVTLSVKLEGYRSGHLQNYQSSDCDFQKAEAKAGDVCILCIKWNKHTVWKQLIPSPSHNMPSIRSSLEKLDFDLKVIINKKRGFWKNDFVRNTRNDLYTAASWNELLIGLKRREGFLLWFARKEVVPKSMRELEPAWNVSKSVIELAWYLSLRCH